MSAYKQFLAQDIIVTPFEVNKSFTFKGGNFTDNLVEIDRLKGISGSFESNQDTTGNNSDQYQVLVYNSIKELYYSNFQTQSWGDEVTTASLFPGETPAGDVMVGPVNTSGRYYNYLQTSLTQSRYFPTESNSPIAVFSLPSRLFGDYVQPYSFVWEDNTNNINLTDDGEGNIISGSKVVGNIIYQHGLAIITTQSLGGTAPDALVSAANVTCSFSSSLTIYETQYKCTLTENEFNTTLNSSIISQSDGTPYDYITGSYFSPYLTTVGLYNENQDLLAIGKLAKPLFTSATTNTTIYINLDR